MCRTSLPPRVTVIYTSAHVVVASIWCGSNAILVDYAGLLDACYDTYVERPLTAAQPSALIMDTGLRVPSLFSELPTRVECCGSHLTKERL